PDVSALVYSSLRLPDCMVDVDLVLIGQIERSFIDDGYTDIRNWERVYAPARRRRLHFNGKNALGVFIASPSDIDDLVPTLTAYQIEWNKLHMLLQGVRVFLEQNRERRGDLTDPEIQMLATEIHSTPDDVWRLCVVWGDRFIETLYKISLARKDLRMQMLSGSLAAYRRGTANWWNELQYQLGSDLSLSDRPVYVVSSNTHSLANLLTGFAKREERNLIEYIQNFNQGELFNQYQSIRDSYGLKSVYNFLYYVLKKSLANSSDAASKSLAADERKIGIHRIPSK